jgi:two-component system chemotaxis sensor kinase CheA
MNSGGDVIVKVVDDGRGYNREKIYQKAVERGLTTKAENEISDSEVYGFTLMAGFSTNDVVSEYSGRGVGMDVVRTNLDNIGGSIVIESEKGRGSTITMHIPLTLAILNGMKITVGSSLYIVPILSIRESLEPKLHKVIVDPNGNEMIMIRGECYPIIRLHDMFHVKTSVEDFNDGIMILVESDIGAACLFADKLLGEQQVVIKPMPLYISKQFGRIKGIAGCSVMGDGGIALILDINRILT